MIYYKNTTTGEVYAYDQEQVDNKIIKQGLVKLSSDEEKDHLARVNQISKSKAKRQIDIAAGKVRSYFLSLGDFIEVEYLRAEISAKMYVDSGYANPVPKEVQILAKVTGMTAAQSADKILSKANSYYDILAEIRLIRLEGKAAIDKSKENKVNSVMQKYIDRLDKLKNETS